MKLNETEWDNVGRDGTRWDDVRQCGTVWDDMGRYGTIWNICEKTKGFLGGKTRTTRFQTTTLQTQHFKQQPDNKRS